MKCPHRKSYYLGDNKQCVLNDIVPFMIKGGHYFDCAFFTDYQVRFEPYKRSTPIQIAAALAKSKYGRSKNSVIRRLFRR